MTASGLAFERKMVTTRYAVSIAQYHTMSSFDSNCPDFHQKQLWKLCYPVLLKRLTLQSRFFAICVAKLRIFFEVVKTRFHRWN